MLSLYLSRCAAVCVIVALLSSVLNAQATGSLTGTVKDPAGAVIVGAQITARHTTSNESRAATTDDQGRFRIENLAPGRYTISVSHAGFKVSERDVEVTSGRAAALEIRMEIEAPHAEIGVSAKGSISPNTEPTYRSLRDDNTFESYAINNLTLTRDVGTLTLKSGRISFLAPVSGRVVKAVFIGEGEFNLKPAIAVERDYMRMVINQDEVNEPFNKLVLCFTDGTYDEIKKQGQASESDSHAAGLLKDFNQRMRTRAERPRSMVEYYLSSEGENLDADILEDVYNPKHPGFFRAYINGKNFSDLRYINRPRGAVPQMLSPEEVVLINYDPAGEREGIIYSGHYLDEYRTGKASSEEDKRIIDAQHYRIETVIDGEKLTATTELTFTPLGDGDRVWSFGLLPNLRVTRVSLGDTDIHYIQEPRTEDSLFYVVMPEAMTKGKQYKITIEYQGNRVVEDEGGGNFAVGARTSWYPSVNAFNDRATFDLTFKVPKQYTLVGVGHQVKEWREDKFAACEWVSDVPLAVAGFNYGLFKKKAVVDNDTKYGIEGYANPELPSDLSHYVDQMGIGGMTPTRLTDNAIVEAQNSMRIFTKYFGESPYGRIAITQQPQMNFGQSWPTLVYLPIISFFDSTQRYMLFQRVSARLTEFIDEVTAHEVSHQWWGHMVGWASYHDQWLSEGFADFSAGLYLQETEPKIDKYMKYWQHQRERVLDKNNFGRRANDAGPIWLGQRLITFKTGGAYNNLVYSKGGYILNMLRAMMWDSKTRDDNFIAMMHDFVQSNMNRNASTESFKAIVDKHMTPAMDLDGNHRMDWFFGEWVYGTEIPSYHLEYNLTPEDGGKFMLNGKLTQSDVSPHFRMVVPIYLDMDGKMIRLGTMPIQGSSTKEFHVRLPQKPRRVVVNAFYDVLANESTSDQK